jgi:hypothetical protein
MWAINWSTGSISIWNTGQGPFGWGSIAGVQVGVRTGEPCIQGANPEKIFDARDLPRLCPPRTPQARVEPGARGGHREGRWAVRSDPHKSSEQRKYMP